MLVVTRRKDEKLMIGNEIEVQILKIGKDSVRIGIKAPDHVSVHRFEVFESIMASNLAAMKSRPPNKELLKTLIKAPGKKPSE
ncbi:MAG: carbon storage regulator CsrA [Terriglobia bacterium]